MVYFNELSAAEARIAVRERSEEAKNGELSYSQVVGMAKMMGMNRGLILLILWGLTLVLPHWQPDMRTLAERTVPTVAAPTQPSTLDAEPSKKLDWGSWLADLSGLGWFNSDAPHCQESVVKLPARTEGLARAHHTLQSDAVRWQI